MTQHLGEKLSVTNNTVSRRETGNCITDVEMRALPSEELGVNIHESVAGGLLVSTCFSTIA